MDGCKHAPKAHNNTSFCDDCLPPCCEDVNATEHDADLHRVRIRCRELENLVRYLAWHCWDAHMGENKHCFTPQSIINGAKFGAEQGWHTDATKDTTV